MFVDMGERTHTLLLFFLERWHGFAAHFGWSVSYCLCSAWPMASVVSSEDMTFGSIQHSFTAHGELLTTSGGSVPERRQ